MKETIYLSARGVVSMVLLHSWKSTVESLRQILWNLLLITVGAFCAPWLLMGS